MTAFELWIRYLAVWPGMEWCGDAERADSLLALSFGGDAWSHGRAHEIGQLHQRCGGDDAETLDALRLWHINVGRPNLELAAEVRAQLNARSVPAWLQWEVALALPRDWYVANAARITVVFPRPVQGRYLSTLGLFRQSRRPMARMGVGRPMVVAHQRMIVRAVWLAQRFDWQPIFTGDPVWKFDPESAQKWTARGLWWVPREMAARAVCLLPEPLLRRVQ